MAPIYTAVSLGPYYRQSTRQARREVMRHRGEQSRTISCVVSSGIGNFALPFLEIAMDPRSLYVIGFRAWGAPFWWEFEPEGRLPSVPGDARRILGGSSNYNNLGLTLLSGHTIEPWRFVAEIRDFDGKLSTPNKPNMILLCFLVAEALRFDSIQDLCFNWINQPAQYFQAPSHYHRDPTAMQNHRIAFSDQTKQTVRSWRTLTAAGSPDVQVPWIA